MPSLSSRPPQSKAEFSPPKSQPLPAHVAVIDDDKGCRDGIAGMIRKLGCKCDAYESVKPFLHAHGLRKVDCIILDVAMPDIDGLTVEKGLRETNYTGPIIFCSGYPEEEIREATDTKKREFYFLRKPVTSATLVEALQRVVKAGKQKR